MSISRLTHQLIIENDDVYVTAGTNPNGFAAFGVWTTNESPSGNLRPRLLISSDFIYPSVELAKSAGEELVRSIRMG